MTKIDEKVIEKGLAYCLKKIQENQKEFIDGFPAPSSENLIYPKWENFEWTPGFWTGLLWMAYEKTQDEKYLETLKHLLPTFVDRLNEDTTLDTHDIGFIYTLSVYPAYQLFKNEEYKEIVIRAAKRLMQRYNKTAKVIQAWGNARNPEQQGRIIIDSLLNMPLLYEASKLSGDPTFEKAAIAHSKNAQKYLVRPDFSSYHTYYFDTLTGKPRFGKTAQGKTDESTWARGEAWAVLGFALNYKHTKDYSLLETACQCADFYLDILPVDLIPFWDLSIVKGDEPRDSSAAAILACGLLELVEDLPVLDPRKEKYLTKAYELIATLTKDYLTEDVNSNGILLHGTYSVPHGNGIDECCIWGDYYYMEALMRLSTIWNPYW